MRRIGTILAIGLRIVLLFVVLQLIAMFQAPWFTIDIPMIHGIFNGHSLIVMLGGLFLMKTALTEIRHMMTIENLGGITARGRSTARSPWRWCGSSS